MSQIPPLKTKKAKKMFMMPLNEGPTSTSSLQSRRGSTMLLTVDTDRCTTGKNDEDTTEETYSSADIDEMFTLPSGKNDHN